MNVEKATRSKWTVAFGICCIVLAGSFIATMNSLVNANSQINNLQGQIDDYRNMINLGKNETINTMTNGTLALKPHDWYVRQTYLDYTGLVWVNVVANSTNFTVTSSGYSYSGKTKVLFMFNETRDYNQYVLNPYFPFIYVSGFEGNNFEILIYNNSTDALTGNLTIIYYY